MKKKLFAIALTILLVGGLLSQINIGELKDFVRGFSVSGLVLAFGIYALSYFFRALRWRQLIHSKEVGLGELTMVTSAHIMFNNLLPSRSGELSYIYLLKKRHGISGSEGLATLVAARLYDFAVLASFFLISAFLFLGTFNKLSLGEIALGSLVILSAAVTLIFNLERVMRWVLLVIQKSGEKFRLLEKKWLRYILEKGNDVLSSFSAIGSKKKFLPLVLISFGAWGFKFFAYYIMLGAMLGMSEGVHPSFWMIVLGTTAAELTTILPVHGVGGFGTYESAWAGAFYLLGFTKELAIKSAFSFHLLALFYSIILGVVSLILLNFKKTKNDFSGESKSQTRSPRDSEQESSKESHFAQTIN